MAQAQARNTEFSVDVLIVGGSLGAVAAAISCGRLGVRTMVVSPGEWLGGQATSQGVPPDEHPWIEYTGSTSTYRDYRARVRRIYQSLPQIDPKWALEPRLNPGAGIVSPLTHDPRVSLQVFEEMLLPYRLDGTLRILRGYRPVSVDTQGDVIRSVSFGEFDVIARQVVDATETGELLPLAGAEYTLGSESNEEFGEPHAGAEADPMNQQAVSWCAALRWNPEGQRQAQAGEFEPVPRPSEYEHWKDTVASFWPGPQLSFESVEPSTKAFKKTSLFGGGAPGTMKIGGLWAYRRIHRPDLFLPGSAYITEDRVSDSSDNQAYGGSTRGKIDITSVNWPQIDYWEGPIIDVPDAELHMERARGLTLSVIHWLQTEAPREDGGIGYPEISLYDQIFETTHGLAREPYIRESRRIRAEHMITEHDIGVEVRKTLSKSSGERPNAARYFEDSVGLASYRIDLHPSTGGDSYIDIESYPAQIPLSSLIHVRLENLLPGGKNIGATHLASGMYRVHPAEWNIGEAAGALAAVAIRRNSSPREISHTRERRDDFQLLLHNSLGFELEWPPHIRSVPRYVPQLQWIIKDKRKGWHLE